MNSLHESFSKIGLSVIPSDLPAGVQAGARNLLACPPSFLTAGFLAVWRMALEENKKTKTPSRGPDFPLFESRARRNLSPFAFRTSGIPNSGTKGGTSPDKERRDQNDNDLGFSKWLLIILPIFLIQALSSQTFKDEQMQFSRVKTAFREKSSVIDTLLKKHDIHKNTLNIFLRAFKNEKRLEMWGKNKNEERYQLIITYPFCEISGDLGPKRKEGDGQIPEGVYVINHFNPESNFYLSLGISYPNRSDAILGVKGRLGGSIYIHGNCVTIGCIPITDDLIKELYLFAVEARNSGQREIPVHIFPTQMTERQFTFLKEYAAQDTVKVKFWENLAQVYQEFERSQIVPRVTIDSKGRYSVH